MDALTDKQKAMGLVYRNGILHIRNRGLQLAVEQNRIGKLPMPGNEINADGMSEKEIVAVIFAAGTIGMWACDGWRIGADGRVFDGPTPVPVRLNEVASVLEDECESIFTITY